MTPSSPLPSGERVARRAGEGAALDDKFGSRATPSPSPLPRGERELNPTAHPQTKKAQTKKAAPEGAAFRVSAGPNGQRE
ncbi:hypothetical protein D9623_04410 [Azospirillum brasilense]|uniref:Uncharacterized protein n=1 Tax=Azospirillum brasilense TaxID=192 RepID=A0A4D8QD89_AZOBR|nr:hypothetical protein D3868_05670 [Azospirillum brasilense]QEL89442.1 hypothetical protein D9621_04415 [Azospirillum brasilense]QEL95689.1 hypothetical protein D9623_04410 [Azospirillum brasilense]